MIQLDFEKPVLALEDQLKRLREDSSQSNLDLSEDIASIEKKLNQTRQEIEKKLTAWDRIQLARHPQRPQTMDYVERIFEAFEPLHGDRAFADDEAIVGGIAHLKGTALMLIGVQKGRDTKSRIRHNFGSPCAEGYRKALRLMRLAQKFDLPIVTLIDTPGAYPGVGSEERHVAEAIAVNIREMSQLTVPILSIVIGEGGSGGALGIGLADKVFILRNAYYSVISPEGCAAILWKDRAFAPNAAEALKIEANELLKLGVVDGVIPEPLGGAHRNWDEMAATLGQSIENCLAELSQIPVNNLLKDRYRKYRDMGVFEDLGLANASEG